MATLIGAYNPDYSRNSAILTGNDNLFQAKYKLFMPTKEQRKLEIEREKELYRLQRNDEPK